MANSTLQPLAPMANYSAQFGETVLREIDDLALVSIAVPNGGRAALQRKMQAAYDLELPEVGRYLLNRKTAMRLLGLQSDQFFLTYNRETDSPVAEVAAALGESGYFTDQSDSWAVLEIKGPECLAALERICPLDLDKEQFPNDGVARTAMEYLGVILIRVAADHFFLLSPRSSAPTFLHMVETSLKYVSS